MLFNVFGRGGQREFMLGHHLPNQVVAGVRTSAAPHCSGHETSHLWRRPLHLSDSRLWGYMFHPPLGRLSVHLVEIPQCQQGTACQVVRLVRRSLDLSRSRFDGLRDLGHRGRGVRVSASGGNPSLRRAFRLQASRSLAPLSLRGPQGRLEAKSCTVAAA